MLNVELSYRQSVHRRYELLLPIFTIVGALVVGTIPLLFIDANPIDTYRTMFISPLTSTRGIIDILVKTVPLGLAGLAVYLPLKAGLWNIGAEGQIYLGGIIATWIAISISGPGLLVIPLMLVVGAGIGGAFGFVAAYARAEWNVNEIISTLLLTFAAIQFNEYVIRGPLQGDIPFPASDTLASYSLLPTFGNTRLHAGVIVLILATIVAYYFVNRTKYGYEITMVGANPDAVASTRINKSSIFILTMVFGGALAGMAGVIEISGVHGRLQSTFSPGYGFTAIPIALLGEKGGPTRVVLVALFFGLLFVGGTNVSTGSNVPTAVIDVLQALIIIFLVTGEFFRTFEVDLSFDRSNLKEGA